MEQLLQLLLPQAFIAGVQSGERFAERIPFATVMFIKSEPGPHVFMFY